MPNTCCCVPLCANRGGHKFPKDVGLRKLWLSKIKRDKWTNTKHSVVCSEHFTADDYMSSTFRGGSKPAHRKLMKNAIPSIFPSKKQKSEANQKRESRMQRRNLRLDNQTEVLKGEDITSTQPSEIDESLDCCEIVLESIVPTDDTSNEGTEKCTHSATQTTNCQLNLVDSVCQTTRHIPLDIANLKHNNEMLHFYTGLETYQTFLCVFFSLGPAVYSLNYFKLSPPCHLDPPNLFFMILIILRQNKTYQEIAYSFSTTEGQVSNIFITWIRFMYLQWREIDLSPSKELTHFFSPRDFYSKFPTTRLIIDGTECPIKKPSLPKAQQASFSSYKNRNTVKVMVGCTPGGLISFVSPSYGGASSDRQIFERNNVGMQCNHGDSIMADKGFDIQDQLVAHNVMLNIPSFFKKANKLSCDTIKQDRKVASKRVHVERVIGLAKTYKILCSPMMQTHTLLFSEIIFVCFMLCNFKKGIVGKYA